jgi:RHS repeat-associated protein
MTRMEFTYDSTSHFVLFESRYTGKERDGESGNDYFGARYYTSSMGRFMSPDPSSLYYANPRDPQSFNLYSYAHNNPLIFVDPNGLDPQQSCNTATVVSSGPMSGESATTCTTGDAGPVDVLPLTAADMPDMQGQAYGGQDCGTCDAQPESSGTAQPGTDLSSLSPQGTGGNAPSGNSAAPGGPSTLQIGFSGSFNFSGPLSGTFSFGFAFDTNGRIGSYYTAGGGLSAGAGTALGLQFATSNGHGICSLQDGFDNVSATGGVALGGTIDGFTGTDSSGRAVSGGGVTVGLAGGAAASAMYTYTKVVPFRGSDCH